LTAAAAVLNDGVSFAEMMAMGADMVCPSGPTISHLELGTEPSELSIALKPW